MDNPIKVLSTKRLNQDFLLNSSEEGLAIDCVDCIERHPVSDITKATEAFNDFNDVILTSNYTWEILHDILKLSPSSKRYFVVGNLLESNLNEYDCEVVVAQNAKELSSKVKASKPSRLLYLKGNLSLDTIENELEKGPIDLSSIVVYETKLLQPTIENLDKYQYIWFFSPSGIQSFNANNAIPPNTNVVAIGHTTGSHLSTDKILVAAHPDLNEMKNTTLNHHRYATV